MSYILDALKKSDKKRQREESVSVLHQVHSELPTFKRSRPRRGLFILLAGITILVFIGFILIFTLRKDQAAPPVKTTASEKGQERIEQPEKADETSVPELRPKKIKVPVINTTSPAEEVIEPQPLDINTPYPPTEIQEKEDNTPYLEELPLSFQESVPEFQLAGHVYSIKPKLRLIMINNKIVREGDIIEDDFILHEITPDGVILRKDSEHFRLMAD